MNSSKGALFVIAIITTPNPKSKVFENNVVWMRTEETTPQHH
jgi:hypothetical protein